MQWEKIFENHFSNKEFIFKKYKEFLQLNTQKNNLIKKSTKYLIEISPTMIYINGQ